MPNVSAILDGKPVTAYLDTGATLTLVANTFIPDKTKNLSPFNGQVYDANGQSVPIIGELTTLVSTPNGQFYTRVLVFHKKESLDYDLLIGMNILKIV